MKLNIYFHLTPHNRCDRQSGEGVTAQLLERLFSFIIPPMIPFKLQQLEAVNPSSFLSSGLQAVPSASGRPTGRNNSTDGEVTALVCRA